MKNWALILVIVLLVFGVPFLYDQYVKIQEQKMPEGPVLETIKFGTVVERGNFVPVQIAIDEGFFKEENINVNIVSFQQVTFMPEMFVRGEIDIASTSPGAKHFNAFNEGVKMQIVADYTQSDQVLLIRKDLWDNGTIKKLEDLKGKTIRTSGEGKTSYFVAANFLESVGLDITKDVKTKTIVSPSDAMAAFEAKEVDAAMIGEPFDTILVERKLAVRYPDIEDRYQAVVIFASEQIMKERPEVLRAFMRAYVKGLEIYNKGYEGEEPERTQVIEVTARLTEASEEILEKQIWHYVDPSGKPNINSLTDRMDFCYKYGFINEKVDINELVNLSFLPGE